MIPQDQYLIGQELHRRLRAELDIVAARFLAEYGPRIGVGASIITYGVLSDLAEYIDAHVTQPGQKSLRAMSDEIRRAASKTQH